MCSYKPPKCFTNFNYIPNTEKYNKQCNVCQVILPLVNWGGGLSLSHTFVVRSEAWTAVAMSTATWYTDIPLSTSTAMLTYTSVFNPLLRGPAKTHALPLTAFHFYISLCLIDCASFANTLFLFQLDTLFYFPYIFTIFFLQFSLHVSDRLVHHQENQITRAASGTFPSFVVISCVAVGANLVSTNGLVLT